jgi:hypothetical protein
MPSGIWEFLCGKEFVMADWRMDEVVTGRRRDFHDEVELTFDLTPLLNKKKGGRPADESDRQTEEQARKEALDIVEEMAAQKKRKK